MLPSLTMYNPVEKREPALGYDIKEIVPEESSLKHLTRLYRLYVTTEPGVMDAQLPSGTRA